MQNELICINKRGVMLDNSTQIEIAQLLEEGHTFSEIDLILDVPTGSSEFTMNKVTGGVLRSG